MSVGHVPDAGPVCCLPPVVETGAQSRSVSLRPLPSVFMMSAGRMEGWFPGQRGE